VQKSGKAWFDSDSQNFNAMVNQLDTGYIATMTSSPSRPPGIRAAWDKVTRREARPEREARRVQQRMEQRLQDRRLRHKTVRPGCSA